MLKDDNSNYVSLVVFLLFSVKMSWMNLTYVAMYIKLRVLYVMLERRRVTRIDGCIIWCNVCCCIYEELSDVCCL